MTDLKTEREYYENILGVVELASRSGIIKGQDLTAIGKVHDETQERLKVVLKAEVQAQSIKDED